MLVVLTAAALLLFRLGDKSLWLDEAFSVEHAQPGLGAILSRAAAFDANQTLYYIVLHFWLSFGEQEFTLRLLSAIFALATVPVLYMLAARLLGRWPGVAAGAALALNAFFIHFGQEVRGYSLALLLIVLETLLFVRALETRGRSLWTAYAATGAIACYVHFFSLIVPVVHVCAAAWRPPKVVPWRRFSASLAGMALAVSPLALFAVFRDRGQLAWLGPPDFADFVGVLRSLTGHTGVIGACVVIAAALMGAVAAHRAPAAGTGWEGWGARMGLIWFLLPIGLAFVISQFRPMFLDRYLLFTLPGLSLLLGAVTLIRPRWPAVVALGLAFAFFGRGLVFWFSEYKKEDWRTATRRVLAESRPGDAIAFVAFPVRVPFEYYVRRSGGLPPGVTIVELASAPYYYGGVMPPPNLGLIRSLHEKHPRVWLVQSHTRRADGKAAMAPAIRALLAENYVLERTSVAPGVAVSRHRSRDVKGGADPTGD